jgi:hypothetical protein
MYQAHGELETLSNSLGAGQGKMPVQLRHASSAAIVEVLQIIQQRGCHATEALAQGVVFRASRGEQMVHLSSLHGGHVQFVRDQGADRALSTRSAVSCLAAGADAAMPLVEQMQHRSVEGILISQSAHHIQITPV